MVVIRFFIYTLIRHSPLLNPAFGTNSCEILLTVKTMSQTLKSFKPLPSFWPTGSFLTPASYATYRLPGHGETAALEDPYARTVELR